MAEVEDRFMGSRTKNRTCSHLPPLLTEEETGFHRESSDDEDFLMPTNHAHEEEPTLPKQEDMVVRTF